MQTSIKCANCCCCWCFQFRVCTQQPSPKALYWTIKLFASGVNHTIAVISVFTPTTILDPPTCLSNSRCPHWIVAANASLSHTHRGGSDREGLHSRLHMKCPSVLCSLKRWGGIDADRTLTTTTCVHLSCTHPHILPSPRPPSRSDPCAWHWASDWWPTHSHRKNTTVLCPDTQHRKQYNNDSNAKRHHTYYTTVKTLY